ncbi:hypothetical protein EYF80_043590 [Liparis tanakae]|uniref:Uncharacterized protein n=1 Tax=Liparis tanakae TaxID=230148 RepID=A0A4Z2FYY6_9TELE|nr:hypothetical protein EYF80_043590 [Liparis tanakae]
MKSGMSREEEEEEEEEGASIVLPGEKTVIVLLLPGNRGLIREAHGVRVHTQLTAAHLHTALLT